MHGIDDHYSVMLIYLSVQVKIFLTVELALSVLKISKSQTSTIESAENGDDTIEPLTINHNKRNPI